MSEKNTDQSQGNGPVETLRDGALKVSIFRNQGERGDYFTAVPSRIFTDERTGEVRETSSLSGSEPIRMANLLQQSHEKALEFKAQLTKSRSRERSPRGRSRER